VAVGAVALIASAPFAHARRPSPGARPSRLRSGALTIRFSKRVYALLTSPADGAYPEHRSLTALGRATAPRPGSFRFPLVRGSLTGSPLDGSATATGGIRFSSVSENPAAGRTSVVQFKLNHFALLLSGGVPVLTATFTGQTTYGHLPVASVVLTHAHLRLAGRRVTLTGLRLKLLSAGAQLFNQQAFNNETRGFRVGEPIGTATLTGAR
jgi:hypothetical protein